MNRGNGCGQAEDADRSCGDAVRVCALPHILALLRDDLDDDVRQSRVRRSDLAIHALYHDLAVSAWTARRRSPQLVGLPEGEVFQSPVVERYPLALGGADRFGIPVCDDKLSPNIRFRKAWFQGTEVARQLTPVSKGRGFRIRTDSCLTKQHWIGL